MNARKILRPLGAGDLLDEAIWLYRKNFLRFVLIAAILRVPFFAVGIALNDPFRLRGLGPLVSIVIDHLLFGNLLAAGIACAVASWVDGRPISARSAYGRVWTKTIYLLINYLTIVCVYGMFGLGFFISSIASSLISQELHIFAWSSPLGQAGVLVLFSVLFIPLGVLPALYLAARWSVSLQVIALENRRPLGALRRSINLMRGQYRRVMVVLGAITLLTLLLSIGPAFLSQTLGEVFSPGFRRNFALDLVSLLFGFVIPALIDLLFSPINFIARALLYYDLRVRAEAYDLVVRVPQLAEQTA